MRTIKEQLEDILLRKEKEKEGREEVKKGLLASILRRAEKKEKRPDANVLPNRAHLRRRGINVTRRMGKPFGRLTRYKMSPASIETLAALHVQDATGKVVRKMVVPRDKVDFGGSK
jgi:hypothetical protein